MQSNSPHQLPSSSNTPSNDYFGATDLPDGWEYAKLEDVCARVSVGHVGPTSEYFCDANTGVPLIRSQNVRPGRLELADVRHITRDFHESLKKSQLRSGDILFVRVGQNRGDVCRVPQGLGSLNCANVVFARPTGIRSRFLELFFRGRRGQQLLRSISVGSAQGVLNTRSIASLPVPRPPENEQEAIAHVLGTRDDKIELNRRMNRTLEAIARAIFKSWFVDFDPVKAKTEGRQPTGMDAETAALFPDSFEDSPLGLIPNGWAPGCLGDVAENPRRGVRPEELDPATPYIALVHMPRRCITLDDWETVHGVVSNKFAFRRGEILFGKLRPYFHKVGVPAIDGVCSTDIVVIAPRMASWFGLALGHTSSDDFVNYTNACSSGTKMPRTNWKDMSKYEIVIPPEPVAASLNAIVQPMINSIHSRIHESRTLTTIRDALLPKLLSGEIRVQDTERIAEEVA